MNSKTLLETIRCEEGKALHLPYHQKRLDTSLKALDIHQQFPLHELISPPDTLLYRCRFVYDENGYAIEYLPYERTLIRSLKLIDAKISYPYKYTNREEINALYRCKDECDDILILKDGLLTDTSIANIALLINNQWLTPDLPLLEGTTRERLIDEGFISPARLRRSDLYNADKIALMNAMMGFVELDNGIIIKK